MAKDFAAAPIVLNDGQKIKKSNRIKNLFGLIFFVRPLRGAF
jgi:hypothetical protein